MFDLFFKDLNPYFILLIGIPKLIATAIDAVEFLILCNPRRGIIMFLIEMVFFPGNFILKLNFEKCLV